MPQIIAAATIIRSTKIPAADATTGITILLLLFF